MYLVAPLPVAAEQRKVGTCGIVLGGVVVQAVRVYSHASYLAGGEHTHTHTHLIILTISIRNRPFLPKLLFSNKNLPRLHAACDLTAVKVKQVAPRQDGGSLNGQWNTPPWISMVLSGVQMALGISPRPPQCQHPVSGSE